MPYLRIETDIISSLTLAASLLKKCILSVSSRRESLANEEIERFVLQTKHASKAASDAASCRRTASSLLLDMRRQGLAGSTPDFFTRAGMLEDEIGVLAGEYLAASAFLKNKIISLMDKYSRRINGLSGLKDLPGNPDKAGAVSSFLHSPEMIDISV